MENACKCCWGIHFYLCLEAKRVRAKLCDAVVLQENTL